MSRKIERVTERFTLQNAGGRQFGAACHTTFAVVEADGAREELATQRRYATDDGDHLNINEDGSFQNVQTEERLLRVPHE